MKTVVKTVVKQTITVKTVDSFKRSPPPLSLKESTVFTVIVCFTTVFTTVFNGFHSFIRSVAFYSACSHLPPTHAMLLAE